GGGQRPVAPGPGRHRRAEGVRGRGPRAGLDEFRGRRAERRAVPTRALVKRTLVMSVTVKVNGSSNSLVHKGSGGMSTATIPDVCKTPSPGGPVPLPYPNIAKSSDLAKGSKTVEADGGNMIAIKGSEFSRSNGDEAGTAGGVKSSTNMKEATWILYSFDVKIDGGNACRLTDKMFHNHENAANMGGEIQDALELSKTEFEKMCENCKGKAKEREENQRNIAHAYKTSVNDPACVGMNGPDVDAFLCGGTSPDINDAEKVGGYYDPVTDEIKINKDPDKECGPLFDEATKRHEKVHQERRNGLVQGRGLSPTSTVFKRAWKDRTNWCKDEVKAHGVTAETYDKFIKECEKAGH